MGDRYLTVEESMAINDVYGKFYVQGTVSLGIGGRGKHRWSALEALSKSIHLVPNREAFHRWMEDSGLTEKEIDEYFASAKVMDDTWLESSMSRPR